MPNSLKNERLPHSAFEHHFKGGFSGAEENVNFWKIFWTQYLKYNICIKDFSQFLTFKSIHSRNLGNLICLYLTKKDIKSINNCYISILCCIIDCVNAVIWPNLIGIESSWFLPVALNQGSALYLRKKLCHGYKTNKYSTNTG